jgi:hypothetical protein
MSDYAAAVSVYRKSVAAAAKKVQTADQDGSERARRKHRKTVEEAIAHFLASLDNTSNDSLKKIADGLKETFHVVDKPAPDGSLAAFLTDGHCYPREERIAMETKAKLKAFQARKEMLEMALTAPEVARMLGTSRQTPHDRAKNNTLLAVSEGNMLRFPLWQFDPDGPNGVLAGLPAVLKALEMPPYSKAVWMTRPHRDLDGKTPLDVLREGRVGRIVELARAAGAK